MKTKTIIKISGVVILATAASFAFLLYKVGEETAMVRCGSRNREYTGRIGG